MRYFLQTDDTTASALTITSRHMSMMVGSMGVMVDEGDSWTATIGDCDEDLWYGDGDGDGDDGVVGDVTGRDRGVGVDDEDDGREDLATDGVSSTSAASAVSVSVSLSSFAS